MLLTVSLFGTILVGQERGLLDNDARWWSGLTYGEKITYVNGYVSGSYALAVVYMEANPGLGGPSLFPLVALNILNTDLVWLVDTVYQIPEYRVVPVAAILIQFRYWFTKLGR